MSDLKDLLVVIDVQNDFIDGVLGSADAQAAMPAILSRVMEYKNAGRNIIVTFDTHYDDTYLNTQEGLSLPVKHCIEGTHGHELSAALGAIVGGCSVEALKGPLHYAKLSSVIKNDFGSKELPQIIDFKGSRSVEFIGLDTDCCVMANAITVRTMCPHILVTVNAPCCAGTSKENHEAALNLMKGYQIEIIR